MGVDKTLSELWHLRGNTDVVSFEELKEESSNTAFMAINTIQRLQDENMKMKEKIMDILYSHYCYHQETPETDYYGHEVSLVMKFIREAIEKIRDDIDRI